MLLLRCRLHSLGSLERRGAGGRKQFHWLSSEFFSVTQNQHDMRADAKLEVTLKALSRATVRAGNADWGRQNLTDFEVCVDMCSCSILPLLMFP